MSWAWRLIICTLSTISLNPIFSVCNNHFPSSLSLPSYFCTVCPVNEYVGGTPEVCQPCPAMSSSPGGVARVCPCMDGTGRVSESDPSIPCVGEWSCILNLKSKMEWFLNVHRLYMHVSHHTLCNWTIDCPGPPENIMEVSLVPPNVELLWHPPATPDKWFFVYLVEWLNETSVVEDSEGTQAILSGLEAAQQYNVTITAYTDSTLCPQQSASFNFTTTQSEYRGCNASDKSAVHKFTLQMHIILPFKTYSKGWYRILCTSWQFPYVLCIVH